MKTHNYLLILCLFAVNVQAEPTRLGRQPPSQHALVIGIDHYQHPDIMTLRGAVNDAKLLRDALRQAGVKLPDDRILLNAQATRNAFIKAWRNMLKQAQPGDTLILTFAGHGGQEPDKAPRGEKDNKDENLIFQDFNGTSGGRITDDELYGLFKQASNYKILAVIDACHSSGMVRSNILSITRLSFRTAGFFNIQADRSTTLPKSDEGEHHSHVTLLTAVNKDKLQVPETVLNKKYHGALSWFFAQAISGKADGNQNGYLERDELERFLTQKVSTQMKQLQKPKLLPQSDKVSVFKLAPTPQPPKPSPLIPDIAIAVENGKAPADLKHVQHVKQAFDLRFVRKARQTEVFNQTGDKITTLSRTDAWQPIIDKVRLLETLATQFDMRLKPIRIHLREGDKLHQKGTFLHFTISPGDHSENLKALTLFGLGAKGELQFLYPIIEYNDSLLVYRYPYSLPPITVGPSLGEENLVVVLCPTPAKGLHALLLRVQPKLPAPEQLLPHLRDCQVGQYAVFSGE
jgi:hypothetical protein